MPPTQSIESALHPPSSGSNNQNGNNHNFVAHIRDLLPLQKHATFHVKLIIHQLYNVPFISGDFKIKWRFTHLQAVNSEGRPIGFGRALALKLDTHKKKKKKHSGGNLGKKSTVDSKSKGKEKCTTPTKDEVDDNDSCCHDLTNSPTTEIPPFDAPESQRPPSEPSQSQQSISIKSDSARSDGTSVHFHTDARGYTPYYPLKNFKVNFEAEVNAVVQMNVERDTHALLPSELKLTTSQHVIPGDPAAPPNARLGHIIINLAEYANVGPVTRNYLLQRSKVNALLKLTLTVTHIGGEENYKAPPLRKEEIKAGFADYLNGTSSHVPLFSEQEPLDDPWLAATIHQIIPPTPPSPQLDDEALTSFTPEPPPQPDSRSKKGWRKAKPTESPRPPPKPLKPRPKKSPTQTEMLIEAIFNPYPSTSDDPSPFTYYVPHMPPPTLLDSTPSDTNSTHASMESSQQGNDSVQTGTTSLNEAGTRSINGNTSKWWRRRPTSRPVTPASGRT